MKYLEYAPAPGLARFIKCYWSLSDFSVVPDGHRNQFLTEGGIELVFNFGDPFTVINGDSVFENQDIAFAIGPMTKAQCGCTAGKCDLFGVCFLPGGAIPFLPVSPGELADTCIDVRDFWANRLNRIAEGLRDKTGNDCGRINLLNQFFGRMLDCPSTDYNTIAWSMRIIRQSNGQIPIEKLAERMGMNRRRLERLFFRMTGISPKQMSRLLRIKSAIAAIMEPSFDGWAGLAAGAGYYDQAHFIREFKMFTGLTPTSYNAVQSDLLIFAPPDNRKKMKAPEQGIHK